MKRLLVILLLIAPCVKAVSQSEPPAAPGNVKLTSPRFEVEAKDGWALITVRPSSGVRAYRVINLREYLKFEVTQYQTGANRGLRVDGVIRVHAGASKEATAGVPIMGVESQEEGAAFVRALYQAATAGP